MFPLLYEHPQAPTMSARMGRRPGTFPAPLVLRSCHPHGRECPLAGLARNVPPLISVLSLPCGGEGPLLFPAWSLTVPESGLK
jgi:hypothetical protein